MYQSAQQAFPGAEVFVAATNDTSARPFPFAVKEKLAKLAGVAPGHFVQVKSPFRAEEITSKFDPARDRLIFVRSEKDADKPPQAGGVKRDGSAAYLQPLAGQTNIRPFKEHAYMAYLPTVEFGPGMTSATEIRTAWPTLNEKRKTALVMSLYPRTQGNAKLANTVVKLLDAAIGTQDVTEGIMSGPGTPQWAGSVAKAKTVNMTDTLWHTHQNVRSKHMAQLARDAGHTPTPSMISAEKRGIRDDEKRRLSKQPTQGAAEDSQQISEYRDRLLQYVKSLLPNYPEYVLKDWLVPNKGDFSNLPDTDLKNGIMEKLKGAGLTPNTKWQLVPNMQFTMDMFEPMTKQRLIGRAGGSSDLGMGIPRDKERHATQAALAQQQGGVRKEPVLLIKTDKGYELLEGWHRTIQHFAKYPDGYTGPAYVAVAQQGVAEVADPRFVNFMNTSLSDRTDQPSKKIKTGQDWYDNTPTMNIDSGMVSYRSALDFCNKTLQKLNPTQKIKLSTMGEQGVVSWLAKQAKKQGLIPDQFMEEDIYEVQDFLPEVFHDPAITSWALVLTDGEPLPTPPTKGPFKVIMNQGLSSPAKGYANSDWVDVDTLDNLPDAEEIFKGMVLKNPNYYVGITGADHKFVKFQDPHKEGMAENFADGRNPQDKGDAKRHGINTKASVSSLRKTAKQGGRKGQLAHWLANMKSGRAKNEDTDYLDE